MNLSTKYFAFHTFFGLELLRQARRSFLIFTQQILHDVLNGRNVVDESGAHARFKLSFFPIAFEDSFALPLAAE